MTMAPFSFPWNFAKSFFSFASKYITAPVIVPGVLGDHPAAAIVSGCSVGLTMRALAFPRVHERSIVQPSRCAFAAPYLANISRVHSFACLSCAEPVNRGPMLSEMYSRFAAASLCSRISARICAYAAANGVCYSPALTNPPRKAVKAITPPSANTLKRRKFIRLPQIKFEVSISPPPPAKCPAVHSLLRRATPLYAFLAPARRPRLTPAFADRGAGWHLGQK